MSKSYRWTKVVYIVCSMQLELLEAIKWLFCVFALFSIHRDRQDKRRIMGNNKRGQNAHKTTTKANKLITVK